MKKIYAFLAKVVSLVGHPVKEQFLKNSIRVRVVVIAGDSVLLVRSSIGSQNWNVPGGGVKKNEPAETASVRELLEETNLKIDPKKLKYLGSNTGSLTSTKGSYTRKFYGVLIPEIKPVKVIRPLEVLEVGWFSLANLPENHSKTLDVALELFRKQQK